MKIRFVSSDAYGGGHLRGLWPADVLRTRGHTTRCEPFYPRPSEYDILVIHRPLAYDTPKRMQKYQDAGVKVFIDEDDDLTTENLLATKNKYAHEQWDQKKAQAHRVAMEMADGVIVSTEPLRELYGERNDNIHVVRNYIPRDMQSIRYYGNANESDLVRVSWAGITETHLHDLEWLRPSSRAMLDGACFVTIGDAKVPGVLGVNGFVQEIHPFQTEMRALYKLMCRAEIGIVPLAPLAFNNSKSWLKALEYMTVGVVPVVARFPEQELLVEHGVNGYLADTPAEMAQLVQTLVRDPVLRARMSVKAKETARKLAIEDHVEDWEVALGAREMETV